MPEGGDDFLTDEQAAGLAENYHYDELRERVAKEPIRFRIQVQLAEAADTVDDSTVHWPESREKVELGTVELAKVLPDTLAQQKQIIFDPIPRVEGIEPSEDPLLELRAAAYLVSGRRRRSVAA